MSLRQWSSLEGRSQLAAEKFAEALEVIPLTAENWHGMDQINTMTGKDQKARTKVLKMDRNQCGPHRSLICELNILEPTSIKRTDYQSAAETACIRIDDVAFSFGQNAPDYLAA